MVREVISLVKVKGGKFVSHSVLRGQQGQSADWKILASRNARPTSDFKHCTSELLTAARCVLQPPSHWARPHLLSSIKVLKTNEECKTFWMFLCWVVAGDLPQSACDWNFRKSQTYLGQARNGSHLDTQTMQKSETRHLKQQTTWLFPPHHLRNPSNLSYRTSNVH